MTELKNGKPQLEFNLELPDINFINSLFMKIYYKDEIRRNLNLLDKMSESSRKLHIQKISSLIKSYKKL